MPEDKGKPGERIEDMAVFGRYAQFYDLLYQDKDYKKECDFLQKVFQRYSRRPVKTILDLGCGTASHAITLVRRGYEVTGVDRSLAMLRIAKEKVRRENLDIKLRLGTIQTVRLARKYDAVVSLFDVMSYQISDEDLLKAFRTVRVHLKKGGLFIFDCWFGPGVLKDRPQDRVKTVRGKAGEKIVRHSQCSIDIPSQIVTVRFTAERYQQGKPTGSAQECHRMRFFFPGEIKILLEQAGFTVRALSPFLKLGKPMTEDDWKMAVVGEKR